LDTFCFDPDTPVTIKGKGEIAIRHVKIGDEFMGGERVTSTFQFNADGQAMVYLPSINCGKGITVSTNHYVLYEGKWIKSSEHPDAKPAEDWSGGVSRPLICLNTSTNSFPIGGYVFRDYDETESGDAAAMDLALKMLNGKESISEKPSSTSSAMACSADTMIPLKNNQFPVPISCVPLGSQLTTGRVIGIVKKECDEVCEYHGERFAPATAVWCNDKNQWRRVSSIVPVVKLAKPEIFYSLVITPSASIQTERGTMFRDYVEVHSPDLEIPYAASMNTLSI
jgi:hypothetical protein